MERTKVDFIEDVEFVMMEDHIDERGSFSELFRAEWFPEIDWSKVQTNISKSKQNVFRGLHYHFNQYDFWYVPFGTILVVLFDFRQGSPTEGNSWVGFLDSETPMGVLIPPGVAHGYYATSEGAALMYFVNNYFDPTDELGINWKDPKFEPILNIDPVVSDRDKNAPFISDINPKLIPRYGSYK